jgi:hypothetical protein
MKSGALLCPECGGKLVVNSYYQRYVIESDGFRLKIKIMQTLCVEKTCGKTHAILPHFVTPYKRYSTAVIELAILSFKESGGLKNSDCPAENSTICGWTKQFELRGKIAANQLQKILYDQFCKRVSMIKLIALNLIQRLKVLVTEFEEFKAVQCDSLIGSVNIILSRYSSGFI